MADAPRAPFEPDCARCGEPPENHPRRVGKKVFCLCHISQKNAVFLRGVQDPIEGVWHCDIHGLVDRETGWAPWH